MYSRASCCCTLLTNMGIWLPLCPRGSLSCSSRERNNTSTQLAPQRKATTSEKAPRAAAGSHCLGSEPHPQAVRKPTPKKG